MRPVGEIRLALLGAMVELSTPDQAPTLQEMANHAQVGIKAATDTVKNMRRHGHVRIVRTRQVGYRNRPVSEYAPVADDDSSSGAGFVDLGMALGAWGR